MLYSFSSNPIKTEFGYYPYYGNKWGWHENGLLDILGKKRTVFDRGASHPEYHKSKPSVEITDYAKVIISKTVDFNVPDDWK